MRAFSEDSKTRQSLVCMLEKKILEKTFGRVRPLEVELGHDKIIVHGRCPSYHIKQLAIQALIDLVPHAAPLHFALDIKVG
jgi:hypothetical protein